MHKQLLLTTALMIMTAGLFGLRAEPTRNSPGRPVSGLTVRVYDYAGLSNDLLVEATGAARGIYAHSGVETRWIQCPTPRHRNPTGIAMYDASCEGPVGPHVIQMRIMPSVPEPLTGIDRFVYGFALPAKGKGLGTAATVFLDRVVRSAGLTKVTEASLLATVMAHEAGHLLLGMNSHSNYGLMSAVWKETEFSKIAEGAFNFFGREKKQIAKNAAARLRAAVAR